TITSLNRAGQRLLSYGESEVAGRLPYVALHDVRELDARACELERELGEPVGAGLPALLVRVQRGLPDEREWHWLRQDGAHVPVRLTVLPQPDPAQGFLVIGRDLSEQRRVDEYIRFLALHDALTGLPNRSELNERAEAQILQARRHHQRVALLLIDLDH